MTPGPTGPTESRSPFGGATLRRIALAWICLWTIVLATHLAGQTRKGWTDGIDRPFGEDFLNFWSAARLAIRGRWHEIYDIAAFHEFQVGVVGHAIDLYHYSYPPVVPIMTAPFAILPYPVAWVAWQGLGLIAFAAALRRMGVTAWALVALAWPAVFVNALGGQVGCWTAAIVGWGMILLPRRPIVAGLILSLLIAKPQLSWLVPLALLAGREWRALAGCAIGAGALLAIATLSFGIAIWPDYAAQAAILKRYILEDGTGTWHRMISAFVLVRHLGAPLPLAYAAQAIVSVAAGWIVLSAWYRGSPLRVAYLVTGMVIGAIYVSDYDCVMLAFPVACLWSRASRGERPAFVVASVLPIAAAVLAVATHVAIGALMLWPLLFSLRRIEARGRAIA